MANDGLIGPCCLHGTRKAGGKPGAWRLEYAVEKWHGRAYWLGQSCSPVKYASLSDDNEYMLNKDDPSLRVSLRCRFGRLTYLASNGGSKPRECCSDKSERPQATAPLVHRLIGPRPSKSWRVLADSVQPVKHTGFLGRALALAVLTSTGASANCIDGRLVGRQD
ncbi:hypothetical protein COCC4DRAFT_27201 [Bipolaris maydis ATCC 48331]|uniref:Uncharacterized protein n=2 Tax=Cochliobolus heterostrophus TaxID=5016 RepID=M2V5A7_COCH5|nr:uncharacterized protein COCC4DRAFT_27201 [Bipolaris maydis ATCC 48331]EMD95157.1 hypothetical protein COCHEDRAFT_1027646 [Bipolaris maydis C5]ENI00952.1 hypothetical protein COCC4DRAFT_27201 [Bipolaris maydis ATCC 48331]KAH7551233.1 hypothetical protein BM1_10107 [Bipolaris maydis]